MTGFGAASAHAAGIRVGAEVRTVNHRFLDVRIGLPREYGPWEGEIRELVRAVIDRGRVEVHVHRAARRDGKGAEVEVRSEVARAYVRALRRLRTEMKLAGDVDVRALAGVPGLVVVSEQPVDGPGEMAAVRRVVRGALAALQRERAREGRLLARDMRARVAEMGRVVERLARDLPNVVIALRDRAAERLRRLAAGIDIDPQRLAQEAAVQAERVDVTEEIVRLRSHLGALAALCVRRDPVGKRIEFLLQELQREINTVGAKVGDARLGALVVEAKAIIEKLREQVQNVE
jgi:uncharacterized protein (TIGR00255 family)